MKISLKKEIIPAVIVIISFIIGLTSDPYLPDRIPTHWNINGEVDGYSGKVFALLFIPVFMCIINLIFIVTLFFEPIRKNLEPVKNIYYKFRLVLIGFLFILYAAIILNASGYIVPMKDVFNIALGGMFIITGFDLPKIKRNHFMGIRFPWTVDSDEVWEKTHNLGKYVFIAAGVFMIVSGFVLGNKGFMISFGFLFLGVVFLFLYSYLEYRRLEKLRKEDNHG